MVLKLPEDYSAARRYPSVFWPQQSAAVQPESEYATHTAPIYAEVGKLTFESTQELNLML